MTTLLTEAFEKASELPENLQDQLARELLEEIKGESQWEQTLAQSQGPLDQMGKKALDEHEEGKTRQMGFDEL